MFIFLFLVFKYFFIFFLFTLLYLKNTVYGVFTLILLFIFASFIMILMGAYFIGFLILIVYVGAVAVLFLFVSMLLNIEEEKNNDYFYTYYLNFFIIFTSIMISDYYINYFCSDYLKIINCINFFSFGNNIISIGSILYTYYVFDFIIISLVMLMAMIGAILLTIKHLNEKNETKIQDLFFQINTNEKKSFVLREPNLYY